MEGEESIGDGRQREREKRGDRKSPFRGTVEKKREQIDTHYKPHPLMYLYLIRAHRYIVKNCTSTYINSYFQILVIYFETIYEKISTNFNS